MCQPFICMMSQFAVIYDWSEVAVANFKNYLRRIETSHTIIIQAVWDQISAGPTQRNGFHYPILVLMLNMILSIRRVLCSDNQELVTYVINSSRQWVVTYFVMVPSISETTILSSCRHLYMLHLQRVVPWYAVVTLNSTSLVPSFRFRLA